MRLRYVLIAVAIAAAVIAGATGSIIGLYGYERHSGYFAPVWDKAGKNVFVIRRSASGFVWGLGWEFFTPPASSYVTHDTFELLRMAESAQGPEVLAKWSGGPLTGRTTHHYRGRIFNYLSARLEPTEKGVRVQLVLSIPRVPSSEVWTIDAEWKPGMTFDPKWTEGTTGGLSRPDEVLINGREVLTLPGKESFDAAVLVVDADGSYSVLLHNRRFGALYPDGVAARIIAERSNRKQIEKARKFRQVRDELVQRFMSEQGLPEGEAILKAYDEMELLGYLPRSPRITARPVAEPPKEIPVFDIPPLYLKSGLFQDIDAAIRSPGSAVKTDLGSYLKYNGDELGPRLKAFRASGGMKFAVRIDDRIYLIEQDIP